MPHLLRTANARSRAMPGLRSQAAVKRAGCIVPRVRVAAVAGTRCRGKIMVGTSVSPCVLGPAGIVVRKREGDGATPRGSYRLHRLLFRADRGPRPVTLLPAAPVRRRDGWCDDARSPSYNRQVRRPFAGGHEQLWRDDRLYDVMVVIGHNAGPVLKGRGSAIFLHIQAPAGTPTAGCVAVEPAVLRRLLGRIGRRTRMLIG